MYLLEVLGEAAKLDDYSKRVAYLDVALAEQPELRSQLEKLLADLDQLKRSNDIQPPVTIQEGNATSEYSPQVAIGTVIAGKYRIRHKLGEGGMGSVFSVDTVRDIKTQFALKLIKPGHHSRHILARFEQERQALALMNHPNIARFIDAGSSETGQPFFVMELIKGISITKYCDQEKLTVEERLKLFQSVCHAVQHAHHKGIIHRDLKPGNILVTLVDGIAIPKVIDFGVAKATLQPLTDKTLHSELNSIIGTLEYMAPEQAEVNSLDIDTRADIYALGVILYELLTGTLPFSRKELGAAAMVRMLEMIREEEPAKPSTKLSHSGSLPSVAATRKIDPASLMKKLRGEIDWIIMKCLEKERGRRYDGSNQLAADIENYLNDLPLQASPPSSTYRLKKFLQRHRGKVLVGAILITSLIAGTIGTTWNMFRAMRAENEAAQETSIAKAVQAFLEDDLLNQMDVEEQAKANLPPDKDIKLRSLLDRSAEVLKSGKLEDQPIVRASLEMTVGKAYLSIGMPEEARPHLERALQLHSKHLGPQHVDTLQNRLHLARTLLKKSDYREAEEALRHLVKDLEGNTLCPLEFQERCQMTWAGSLSFLNRYDEAEKLYDAIYQSRQKRLGNRDILTLQAGQQLAGLYLLRGNHPQAQDLLLHILALQREVLGNKNPSTVRTIQTLTSLYVSRKEFSKAAPFALEAVATGKLLYQDDHPLMMIYYNDLAAVQVRLNQEAEAVSTFAKLTALSRARNGEDHANTIDYALNWASCLFLQKKYAEAEEIFRQQEPLIAKKYGVDHSNYRSVLRSLAKVCEKSNRLTDAEKYWTELLTNSRASKNVQPGSLYIDLLSTAKCKLALHKLDDLKITLADIAALGQPSSVQPYHQAMSLRLQAERALLVSDQAESKRCILGALTVLKRDIQSNPERYQQNPFAIEERKALRALIDNWTNKYGQDVDIEAQIQHGL